MSSREDRQYRSRLEILRDFLGAMRETGKKTRVIGLANLNPASYQPYLEFCLAHHLVQDTSAGYRLTPRADHVLEAIDRIVGHSAEVDAALADLQRGLEGTRVASPSSRPALRYVSLVAFHEMIRNSADARDPSASPVAPGRVGEVTASAALHWSRSGGHATVDPRPRSPSGGPGTPTEARARRAPDARRE